MSGILVALKQGDLDFVKNLIKTGTNLNIQDEQGMTPLQYSIEKGYRDIVELLLSAGADPNIENCLADQEDEIITTKQPLDLDGNAIIEQIIADIKNLRSTSALHIAIKRNDVASLKLLLEYGADPNVLDLGFCTPLHWAATKSNLDAVQILLDAKINPNVQDLAKSTALHEAVRKKNIAIIKILMQYGADPRIADIGGETAFDLVRSEPQLLDTILSNYHTIPAGGMLH